MQHDLGTAHDEDLKSLNSRAHEDFEKIADSGVNYPCIIVSSEVFARLASVYGEGPLTVNVDLDILRDGTGNVFVDVKFSAADVHESFLIDAAKHTWFFHVLAESSVGVAPKNARPHVCIFLSLQISDSDQKWCQNAPIKDRAAFFFETLKAMPLKKLPANFVTVATAITASANRI